MPWISRYIAPLTSPWQGRPDLPPATCLFQVINNIDLTTSITPTQQPAFALIGFCCDAGIQRNYGRQGAAEGPGSIRKMMAAMPIPRQDALYFDAGNIICEDGNLEESQQALATVVDLLLTNKFTPIILGGGHELAWGHYQGIAPHLADKSLGIINFDAHFDMRPLLPEQKGSSGTPFLQIAKAHDTANRRFDYNCIGIQQAGNMRLLFETAEHYRTHVITADQIHQQESLTHTDFIQRIIADNDKLYVSLCLDVFAAPFAPGVSAPQPMGILPWTILPAVRQLAASGKVISYDIAEMSPPFDRDNRTAKLAATFIFEIMQHHQF